MTSRRSFVAAVAALSWAGAHAQTPLPPSFAVYSEAARELNVVLFQQSTGSRLGANNRMGIDIPEGALDKIGLVTVRKALQQAMPVSPVWLIAPLTSDAFDATLNPADGDTIKLPDDFAAAFKERGTTHLLLFQRYRAEARLKAQNDLLGSGRLEGLGYYVDTLQPMRSADNKTIGRGFLAPYVYIRASLVDARSGRVLRTRTAAEGVVLSGPDTMAGTKVWELMTPQRKLEVLRDGYVAEIERLLPELLAGLR
jgi:hypothetical protein